MAYTLARIYKYSPSITFCVRSGAQSDNRAHERLPDRLDLHSQTKKLKTQMTQAHAELTTPGDSALPRAASFENNRQPAFLGPRISCLPYGQAPRELGAVNAGASDWSGALFSRLSDIGKVNKVVSLS